MWVTRSNNNNNHFTYTNSTRYATTIPSIPQQTRFSIHIFVCDASSSRALPCTLSTAHQEKVFRINRIHMHIHIAHTHTHNTYTYDRCSRSALSTTKTNQFRFCLWNAFAFAAEASQNQVLRFLAFCGLFFVRHFFHICLPRYLSLARRFLSIFSLLRWFDYGQYYTVHTHISSIIVCALGPHF